MENLRIPMTEDDVNDLLKFTLHGDPPFKTMQRVFATLAQWRIDRIEARAENDKFRERLQIDPGGSDKIDELEQAMEFTQHALEVAQKELKTLLQLYGTALLRLRALGEKTISIATAECEQDFDSVAAARELAGLWRLELERTREKRDELFMQAERDRTENSELRQRLADAQQELAILRELSKEGE